MRRILWAALLLLLPALLRAQDSVIVIDPDAPPTDTLLRGGPPSGVVAELIRMFNDHMPKAMRTEHDELAHRINAAITPPDLIGRDSGT